MMLIETQSKDRKLIIEVEDVQVKKDDEYRSTPRPVQKLIDDSKDLFGDAMSTIRHCADRITNALNNMPDDVKPSQVEASLAIKISAQAGAVLTKLAGEGQLQVKLTWKRAG
ncbi:MAG: CU044_2847 family protein [Desulfobacterales bacterium]